MPSNNMYYDVFVKSVDLEEALEDSPMLRKKIKNAENVHFLTTFAIYLTILDRLWMTLQLVLRS